MYKTTEKSLKNQAFSNLFWRFLERSGAQIVTFIVSIILARLLNPTIYGTLALVTIFMTIMQVFIDSGLGNALIQKKGADDIDFSTVFYFNIVVCLVLYVIMFFLAPLIAEFYKLPELVSVVRVTSLTLIVSGVRNIQQAYVSKNLLFKRFFYSTIGGVIVSAVVGIWMAFEGYGLWALVAQNLVNQTVGTIILWFSVKWRPILAFSWERLKGLFSYGWKLLVSALIDTVYNDLRQLIIGKKYTTDDLALYNKGKQFPNLIITNINTSIDSVLLPTMSSEQDNREKVKAMTRRAINISSYLIWPLMIGLCVCSESIVRLLLTEKWMGCVPYLRIFCCIYVFYPIHTSNLNAIKALGRSDIFLKQEIIRKIVGIIAIAISMWYGVLWMAYSLIFTTIISFFINAWPNIKLLKYNLKEQIYDIIPYVFLSAIMGAVVFCVSLLGLSDILTLLIQIPLGILIYIGVSKLFRFESFEYILALIKDFFKKASKTDAK